MLFKQYTTAAPPTKVKIEDVDKAHVKAIYDRLVEKGSPAKAWVHEFDENNVKIEKAAETDYKLSVYRDVYNSVKEIISKIEELMKSDNPPSARADLTQAIKDSGLKIVGLPLSDILNDVIAHSDGDVNSGTTWAQFKDMFNQPVV